MNLIVVFLPLAFSFPRAPKLLSNLCKPIGYNEIQKCLLRLTCFELPRNAWSMAAEAQQLIAPRYSITCFC